MSKKILKGLTKQLIKASKNPELCFTQEQLETIQKTAEVTLYKNYSSYLSLSVFAYYGEDRVWRGYISFKNPHEGYMEIVSGFTRNPIGLIRDKYTCTRANSVDYREEFKVILEYMVNARKSSLAGDRAYIEFVRKTGCLD